MIPLNLTQLFSNNAVSLLAESIGANGTSLRVIAGHGALFPQPTGDGSDYFLITLEDQSASVREIIKVTRRVNDTLYFDIADRGLEGTTARNWSSESGNETLVDHRITADTMLRAMQLPVQTPAVVSGTHCFNQEFTLHSPVNGKTDLVLAGSFQQRSTQVYVGGMRLKLGVDYVETSSTTITLQFELTQSMINDGQHVTIDFLSA